MSRKTGKFSDQCFISTNSGERDKIQASMPEKLSAVFNDLDSKKVGSSVEDVAERLVDMIYKGGLGAGDRLPPERDLAKTLGVSRPTLRAGIRSLSTVGILRSRQGAGTFVAANSESQMLDSLPLRMFWGLYGFTPEDISEARMMLEVMVVGLAAERADSEHLKIISKEVAGMSASLNDPRKYLAHEMRFHQAVAAASQNRVLIALMNMLLAIVYGSEDTTPDGEIGTDLEGSAERHQRVYRALRGHDIEGAQNAMRDLLETRHGKKE